MQTASGMPVARRGASARYSALDRSSRCPAVTGEAVATRRELAAAMPERYRLDLACSLRRMADIYENLGQVADADPIGAEAAQVTDAGS